MTNTTTTRRAFIAPCSEPTNGAWHDLNAYADREALETAALAQITKTPENAYAEELDCPDHEGFGAVFAGQYYVSTAEVWAAHEWLTACEAEGIAEDVAHAYAEYTGERMPDPSDIVDVYAGEYDSVQAYAEGYVEDSGMLSGVDDTVARYFDYEAFARDLVLGGDLWTTDRKRGSVHIFRTR
jgi:antirestriction protein